MPENCSYVKITVDGEIEGQHVIHWRQVVDGSSTNQFVKRRYPKTQGQGYPNLKKNLQTVKYPRLR